MSQREDEVRLRLMLDYAREAHALVLGRCRADLESDHVLELALTRLLEIIGEAAARMTDAMQAAQPHIPWREIIGLRNRLIHGYDAVDLDILWDIIQEDLPRLIEALEKILGGH
jgi:uncharacterized protein with HEPN domain